MTRDEFCELREWSDIIDFCREYNLSFCDYVYDSEAYDDEINEELERRAQEDSWYEVKDWLDSLDSGYDYYIKDGWGDFEGASNGDFDRICEEILDYCDDEGLWDEEEEEEEPEEYLVDEEATEEDEDDDVEVEEGCSIEDLFGAGVACIRTIEQEREEFLNQSINILMQGA